MFFRTLSLAILALATCIPEGSARSLYIRATGAYAAPVALGSQLQLDGYPYSGAYGTEPGDYVQYREKASLAAGNWAGISAGMQIRGNLGIEIAYDRGLQMRNYESASRIRGPYDPRTDVSVECRNPGLLSISGVWTYRNMLQGPYIRLGVVIPLSRDIRSVARTTDDSAVYQDFRSYETAFGLGVRGALGYSLPLSKRISVFGEAAFLGMAFRATEARLTGSTRNGEDQMQNRTTREKRVVYTENYLEDRSLDPGQPGHLPQYRIPFSNVSLGVGVTVALLRD